MRAVSFDNQAIGVLLSSPELTISQEAAGTPGTIEICATPSEKKYKVPVGGNSRLARCLESAPGGTHAQNHAHRCRAFLRARAERPRGARLEECRTGLRPQGRGTARECLSL